MKKDRRPAAVPEAPPENPQEGSRVLYLDEGDIASGVSPLLSALTRIAKNRGHTLAELASALDVTYGYLVQLKSGARKTQNISSEFALKCASYLGVPRLTVLMLAGQVTSEDFFQLKELSIDNLRRALDYIRGDPYWGPTIPDINEAKIVENYALVLLIIRMYEDLTGTELIPGVGDPSEFTRKLDAMREKARSPEPEKKS
jgi:transcriptional regulator with XRE-family HTH domain